MCAKANPKDDGKALGGVIADARKRPLNFALLMGKDGLVIEADARRPVLTLKRDAKSNGGSKGVWGTMLVEANRVTLTCEREVPGGIEVAAKKYFSDLGFPMKIIFLVAGEAAGGADEADPSGSGAEPELQDGRTDAPNGTASDNGLDAAREDEEVPPEDPDNPDDADDLAAAAGDLDAIMRAARKFPYNFAMLRTADSLVLKAHKRKPVDMLFRQAKAEGAMPRGGWGTMLLEGKSLVMQCVEDPPASFAKAARAFLKERGHPYRIVLRCPGGEFVEDEPTADTLATGAGTPDPAEQMRVLRREAAVVMGQVGVAVKAGGAAAQQRFLPLLKTLKLALGSGDTAELDAAIAAIRQDMGGTPGASATEPLSLPNLEKMSFAAGPEPPAPAPAQSGDDRHARSGPAGSGDVAPAPRPPPAASKGGRKVPYSIPVTRTMDNLEFSIHVDMVALGMTREQAVANNKNPANRITPSSFTVTEAHVKAGSVIVHYTRHGLPAPGPEAAAAAQLAFGGFPKARQDDINSRTDAAFWKHTNYKPDQKLDPKDPNFKAMSDAWKAFHTDEVMHEQRMDRIPPAALRFFRFDAGGVPITAENIDQIVAIANKVKGLSDEAMADYWARTTGKTQDVGAFAVSVDSYLAQLANRQATRATLDDAHNKLVGKEALYKLYRKATRDELPESMPGGRDDVGVSEYNVEYNAETRAAMKELAALLPRYGYGGASGQADFEADLATYSASFEREAVAIANDAMDRRTHVLQAFEAEVLTDNGVQGMFNELAGVRAQYQEAAEKPENRIHIAQAGRSFPDKSKLRPMVKQAVKDAIARDAGLTRLFELRKSEDPAFDLDDDMIDMMTDAKDPADLKKQIMSMLEERREGIAETKALLKKDPRKVWSFDKAIAQAGAETGVGGGTVQADLVQDGVKKEARRDLGKKILIGVLAIGAGLLTFGKGAVVVVGAAAALGFGAYGAWDTYVTYAEQDAAHKAGMSSTDPSFAWVVVSLATLPLDVLGLASGIKAAAKAAHIARLLETGSEAGKAVRAFNTAREAIETAEDAAVALARLEKDLAPAQKAVRDAILRAARAEAEANTAWAVARAARGGRVAGFIDPVITPLLDLAASFAYPVCLSIRKGMARLDVFLKTKYAKDMIKGVEALSPEALTKVSQAFDLASDGYGKMAKRAVELGLSDAQVDEAFKVWGRTPAMPTEKFVADVLEPMAKARATVPAYDTVMKQAEGLPGGVGSLEAALKKAATDPAYAKTLEPHLKGIRDGIAGMDKAARDALPEASKSAIDTMRSDIAEHMLRQADIPAGTSVRQAPKAAELDPARVKSMNWNHEQKAPDIPQGIGGARLERATGRPITQSTVEGADLVDGADLLSLKGPILNKKTGAPIPINDKMVDGLAKAVVKDMTQNTASQRIVVDMLGMSQDQVVLLQSKIAAGLKDELAKGLIVQNGKTIVFLE